MVTMLTETQILKVMEENYSAIKRFGVKTIGLFGSYLQGEQDEDSDIDILVEFAPGKKTFDNYMGLKFFLEDTFNLKVDLVVKEAVKVDLRQHILGSVRYAAGV